MYNESCTVYRDRLLIPRNRLASLMGQLQSQICDINNIPGIHCVKGWKQKLSVYRDLWNNNKT